MTPAGRGSRRARVAPATGRVCATRRRGCSAPWRSTAMCTARISSGINARAYWIARAVLWSIRATKTSTTWRRRIGCVHAASASRASSFASRLVLTVQAHQHVDEDGDDDDDDPRTMRELRDRDDDVDDQRQDRARRVDEEPALPVGFLARDVMLGHPGLRQRERREHADRVERDQLVDLGAASR